MPRQIEPLMGWTSSTDMKSQIRLRFDSKEEAIAYAQRNGIAYRVEEPKAADAQDRVLFRQFPHQPRRSLVALTLAPDRLRLRSSAG